MAKDLTAALAALSEDAAGSTSRKNKTLPVVKSKSAIPERSGTAKNKSSSGTAGIAGPLVEISYASRTFHASKTLLTSDGMFGLVIKPVNTVTFEDALENIVVMEYKAPT